MTSSKPPGRWPVDDGRSLSAERPPALDRLLTDASRTVVTRYAFDAWGKRRDIDWTAFTVGESLYLTTGGNRAEGGRRPEVHIPLEDYDYTKR